MFYLAELRREARQADESFAYKVQLLQKCLRYRHLIKDGVKIFESSRTYFVRQEWSTFDNAANKESGDCSVELHPVEGLL